MSKIKQIENPTIVINGRNYICQTWQMTLDDFLKKYDGKEIYLYEVSYNNIRAIVI